MRSFKLLVAASVLLTLLAGTNAHAAGRTEDYVAGSVGDSGLGFCAENNRAATNIGAVCMPVTAGTAYSVRFADDTGLQVGFYHEFDDAAGNCVGTSALTDDCGDSGFHCNTAANLRAPTGAVELVLILDGPVFGAVDCLIDAESSDPGFSTNGKVTVTP